MIWHWLRNICGDACIYEYGTFFKSNVGIFDRIEINDNGILVGYFFLSYDDRVSYCHTHSIPPKFSSSDACVH